MRLAELIMLLQLAVLCVSFQLAITVRAGAEQYTNPNNMVSGGCGSELLEGLDIPADIEVPAGYKLRVAYYAEGLQHYYFNGSAWVLFNATATLYSTNTSTSDVHNMSRKNSKVGGGGGRKLLMQAEAPAKKLSYIAVGQHFFLSHPDPAGGQPSWETAIPAYSLVTARALQAVTVDPQSITWDLLQATSHSGSSDVLGAVTYLQRLASKGGLPPTTTLGIQFGEIHVTPYSIIYAFYVVAS